MNVMQTLKSLPWKRILVMLFGAGGIVEAVGGSLPPTWQAPLAVLGGFVGGVAINAERVMAKRKTPAAPFDVAAAREKLEKMQEKL